MWQILYCDYSKNTQNLISLIVLFRNNVANANTRAQDTVRKLIPFYSWKKMNLTFRKLFCHMEILSVRDKIWKHLFLSRKKQVSSSHPLSCSLPYPSFSSLLLPAFSHHKQTHSFPWIENVDGNGVLVFLPFISFSLIRCISFTILSINCKVCKHAFIKIRS